MVEITSRAQYHSFEQLNFTCNGHDGCVILPVKPRPDRRYIWRAEFLGGFDTVDVEMVKRGWYLAYYRISDMYGNPESVELMEGFRAFLAAEFGLYEKPVLFGFSRGGLYSANYAATYSQYVSALYLDAPVCDIRSWPLYLYKEGHVQTGEGLQCLEKYGITLEEAASFTGNPNDKADVIADRDIPVFVVAGDSDDGVPFERNAAIFIERYQAAGGKRIELILKPNCGHHPHSLDDPTPVADFIEANI